MIFRMLIAEQALARLAFRLRDAGLDIEPVILHPDGRLTLHGRPVTIEEAAITSAWQSPDLFALGQYHQFLDLAIASASLQWMQSGRSGYDEPAFATLASQGVRLSMSKAPAIAMAEYVMAHVLDLFQRGRERRADQQAQIWRPLPFREVAGSQWLCIGFGAIGKEVARRARAFGAHVTGVRRRDDPDADADAIVTPDAMGPALARADIVVLTVPLTTETANAFGAPFFAAMRRGAVFVNIARGELIDESALRDALDSGRLAHAILDVVRNEPLGAGAWQWSHGSVTLTAHSSAMGSGLTDRTDQLLIDNMLRYRAGEALLNEVDPRLLHPDFARLPQGIHAAQNDAAGITLCR